MRRFTQRNPPAEAAALEDAFAEFAPEPAVTVRTEEERDWFAEFPEEDPATTVATRPARAPSWRSLSVTLKDE